MKNGIFLLVLLMSLVINRSVACPTIDSINVTPATCLNTADGMIVINISGGTAPFQFSIDGGTTFNASNTYTNLAPGTYIIVVQSAAPCSVIDTVTVGASSFLSASLSVSTISGFFPLTVDFSNSSFSFSSSQWDFGDGTPVVSVTDTSHTFTSAGTYTTTLTVTDGACTSTATVIITVGGTSSLTIPNVFSPNLDDINDIFQPAGVGIKIMTATIYNRYGEIVHVWNGPNGFWDGFTFPSGIKCSEGTYYYEIYAEGYDGVVYDEKGILTLLR
ncbi:MAG: gliding motility-associated C-terminal domain-containing protein [Bacteroidota bacterium]